MKALDQLREAGVFEDDRPELVLTAGFKHELMKRQCQNAIYKGSDRAVILWAINTWIKPFEMVGDLHLPDHEKVKMALVLDKYLEMTHPMYIFDLWSN